MSGATMGEIIPPVFETKILTNKTTPEFLKNSMGVALEDDIPTKTSELDNDSEFVDRDFVNSSIATNTANFKGTFNNESEFPTEATNNDYLFWKTVDEDGNTIYKRYKYIASTSTWTYEYTLNNSSFTAQQWATINGGPYATQTSLNEKQDKLPLNDQWDVYDIGCWSAINATRDVHGNWIDETYATKDEVPTKTSQLENDSGFISQGPNIKFGNDYDQEGYLDLGSDALGNSEIRMMSAQARIDVGWGGSPITQMNDYSHIRWNGKNVALEEDVDTKIDNIPTTTMSGEYEDGTTFSFNVLLKE